MRRAERQTPRLVKESGKGRAHADYPSALHAVHQRALRIDGVGDPGEVVNVGNADQSPAAQEMTPTMPWMQLVRSLPEEKSLPYLWFTYGVYQKGPAK
jgi:hypothetical protein